MKMSIENVARICHEANRAYCAVLGDLSQNTWRTLNTHLKESTISGVKFLLSEEGASGGNAVLHDNWVKDKVAAGYIYGTVKDDYVKTHPCLVPWEALTPEQQYKDVLFRSVVYALRDIIEEDAT